MLNQGSYIALLIVRIIIGKLRHIRKNSLS